MDQYLPDPSHEWEKSRSNSSGSCKELECIQNDQGEQSSRSSGSSAVEKTYSRTSSLTRSTSCNAVIEEMTPEYNVVAESMVTNEVEGMLPDEVFNPNQNQISNLCADKILMRKA